MRLFWGESIQGWRMWGVWIQKKYWFGFSVVEHPSIPLGDFLRFLEDMPEYERRAFVDRFNGPIPEKQKQ